MLNANEPALVTPVVGPLSSSMSSAVPVRDPSTTSFPPTISALVMMTAADAIEAKPTVTKKVAAANSGSRPE